MKLGTLEMSKKSRIPKLRSALDIASSIAGTGGTFYGIRTNNPAVAALSALGLNNPTLFREGIASYHAMKALRSSGKYTDEELKR